MAININVNVDIDQLKTVQTRLKRLKPALMRIANMIKEDARLNFVSGSDPYGMPWQPLKPATYNRKRPPRGGASARPLRDTGRLMNSIAVGRVTNQSAIVGTNLIYSAIHNFGGKAGRNHSVIIPRRQYLPTDGLTREQQTEAKTIIEEYLFNGG